MSKPIEDYALIGDRRSAALVARDGSIDWLCWPHFDSDACFAALLGDARHGCWRLGPRDAACRTTRRYRGDTLILETRHETADGAARLIDLMPIGSNHRAVIRQIEGESGSVAMTCDLAPRFDHGSIAPWMRVDARMVTGVVGPDLVVLRAPVDVSCEADRIVADFTIEAGQILTFTLQYGVSYNPVPEPLDAAAEIAATEDDWRDWISRFDAATDWPGAVRRSLITLKALTDRETGGIIAAPTTSLPEVIGGPCNWDYRYSWLRDSTFALTAFLNAGFHDEARAWRDWLLRAAAGGPDRLQTMYRVDGSRHTRPDVIAGLPGWKSSVPVHVGNPAATQFQLDIYGEVLDSLHLCEQAGLGDRPLDSTIETRLVAYIEKVWEKPDQGIWESRGPPRHFTHSKVMAWVGIDRFLRLRDIAAPRRHELEALRARMHRSICQRGFNTARNSFVQAFDGEPVLDASLLMLPLVKFLPADDPRIVGTIAAIEADLVEDGLARRWSRAHGPDEGAFMACTCWLADCLAMQGRQADARAYLERVIARGNDVGLLSEEWDTRGARMLGNFPQALTHLALVNTALGLCGPVLQRGGG